MGGCLVVWLVIIDDIIYVFSLTIASPHLQRPLTDLSSSGSLIDLSSPRPSSEA